MNFNEIKNGDVIEFQGKNYVVREICYEANFLRASVADVNGKPRRGRPKNISAKALETATSTNEMPSSYDVEESTPYSDSIEEEIDTVPVEELVEHFAEEQAEEEHEEA